MTLPDFEAWAAFAKVASTGSFARAAKELSLSNATVSKLISRLERRIGERLFHRSSRRLALTATGRVLAARAARFLAEAEDTEAEATANARAPRGVLRVSAPMSFGLKQVAPLLPAFMKRYPEIAVELQLDDRVIDVIAGAIDVAVRVTVLADSSLMMRRLCPMRRFVVAAPSYLKRRGTPARPRDLADHACLHYSNLVTGDVWHLATSGRRKEAIRVSGPLTVNNADAVEFAAEAGLGLALQPDFIAWPGLKSGKLVRVLPEWEAPLSYVHLITPSGAPRASRVNAFMDFLAHHFAQHVLPWADL